MTSFFAQIWILIKRIPPYSKKCLLKTVCIFLLLIGFVTVFHYCSDIPTTTLDVYVETYNMPRFEMELYSFMGYGVHIKNPLDSTFLSPFFASNRFGIEYNFTTDSLFGRRLLENRSFEPAKCIKQLKKKFQEDSRIDSLESMIHTSWKIQRPNRKIQIYEEKAYRNFFDYFPGDSSSYRIFYLTNKDEKASIKSEEWVLFNNPKSQFAVNHNAKVFRKGPFYNTPLWALYDVSQSYVGLTLTGWNRPDTTWHYWGDEPELENCPVKLTVDFGSAVSITPMTPAPDRVTMTGVVFESPEKIRSILTNGVVCHVKYLQNEGIQSMKLFWISTIITALATWLVTTLFRWIQFAIRRRKQTNHTNSSNSN